jgi:hypothetical protein
VICLHVHFLFEYVEVFVFYSTFDRGGELEGKCKLCRKSLKLLHTEELELPLSASLFCCRHVYLADGPCTACTATLETPASELHHLAHGRRHKSVRLQMERA